MTRTIIYWVRYLKRKTTTELTADEKKKLLNGEIVMSHYATDYFFYKIIK